MRNINVNLFMAPSSSTKVWAQRQNENGIRSDVILGSPSAHCNGVGICRVMGRGEAVGLTCPSVPATLKATPQGALRMELEKKTMDAAYRRKHFNWMLFQVVEPYRLSPKMRRDLGCNGKWIQPGVYQVWETEKYMIIEFPMTDQ